MAWIIQSTTDQTVIVSDINIIFGPKQIRNLDLIGRRNAESSHNLKQLLSDGTFKEIRKDPSEDTIDPKLVQQLQETVKANQQVVQAQTQTIQTLQTSNTEVKQQNEEVKKQNEEIKLQNEQLKKQNETILEEVRKFAENRPIDVKTYAEAMRNILSEHGAIVAKREELSKSGESEAEIKAHDKVLALKEKKLEKNVGDLGKTVSHSAKDFKETLDALDQLNL